MNIEFILTQEAKKSESDKYVSKNNKNFIVYVPQNLSRIDDYVHERLSVSINPVAEPIMNIEFILAQEAKKSESDKYISKNDKNFIMCVPQNLSRIGNCVHERLNVYISPVAEPIVKNYDNVYKIYNQWEKETRNFHSTIQSILDIPIGESRTFLCLDRNALDIVENRLYEIKKGIITPSELFENNYYIRFVRTTGIMGKIDIFYKNQEKRIINDEDKDDDYGEELEFDINYIRSNWYPLKNGELPAIDSQFGTSLLGKVRDWKSFPKTTRIGWRGPMIPIEKIDKIKIKC